MEIQFNYGEYKHTSTGIYKITISSHVYIGSAASKQGFCGRWGRHSKALQNGTHFNKKMQNCFNKYQIVNFEILELCEPSICIEREQYWVNKLLPDINIRLEVVNSPLGTIQSQKHIDKRVAKLKGTTRTQDYKTECSNRMLNLHNKEDSPYNGTWKQHLSESHTGKVFSDVTKMKMSNAHKGNSHASKAVLQFDLDGNFIQEWESAKQAKDILGIKGNISQCCKGQRKTASGFMWKFKNNNDNEHQY